MLAERLVRASNDILAEYDSFKISDLLSTAVSLAAQRGRPGVERPYALGAHEIREQANNILRTSKLQYYPSGLIRFLEASKYSPALPMRIARTLLNGFPDDQSMGMSSSEVQLQLQISNTLRSELGALVIAGRKFNIDGIIIPDGQISLDVVLPRIIFENESYRYIFVLAKFNSILSYFIELSTGSKGSPTLTYTSTSDPVTGLALAPAAVWAFLQFYKLALEVAEKQISLCKTIKELQRSSLSTPDNLEEQVKGFVGTSVGEAVASIPANVPKERANEISVAIGKDARVVVQAIANGARVGITIESIDKLSLLTEAVPGLTPEIVKETIGRQRALEEQVGQAIHQLGEPAPALLPDETS